MVVVKQLQVVKCNGCKKKVIKVYKQMNGFNKGDATKVLMVRKPGKTRTMGLSDRYVGRQIEKEIGGEVQNKH